MKAALRIGLVGFGRMGQDHWRILESLSEARVCVVVEPNQRNLDVARASVSGSDVAYFSDLDMALECGDVDGWVVSSSTHSHVEVTRSLLAIGSKVLLEKPIADSMQSALELRAYVSPDSSNLMMGHILLWSEEFTALLDRVKKRGQVVEISAIRPRSTSHLIDYPNESPFSLLMVHDLYCIYVLTGGVEPSKVLGESFLHESGGENRAIGALEWANGVRASAEANYLIPDGDAQGAHDVIAVKGKDWEERATYGGNFDSALRSELQHFLALLRGQVQVPLGARYEDAVHIQGWVDTLIATANHRKSKGE